MHNVVEIMFTLCFSLTLSACTGCFFSFSSVACFILSSLAFLLALKGLHPLKLDGVGFCVVPFRLMVAWHLDLFLDFASPDGCHTLALYKLWCGGRHSIAGL